MTSITRRSTEFTRSVRIAGERYLRILLPLFCISMLFAGPGYTAQLTFAWKPNTGENVAGYRVYYGTASRVYNWFFDVGNATTYTVTGIPDGGTYYFALTAYHTSGIESPYSAEVIWYESAVDPMVNEITIGSQFSITGSNLGAKKGKVLVGTTVAEILSWNDTSITCSAHNIPIPSGPHDAIIKPRPYKSISPIILPGALIVVNPELDPFSIDYGSPKDKITITGKFFGSKMGKVYLENPSTEKKKYCKVTSWSMDPTTGISTLKFVVPKGLVAGTYHLKVKNKVGTASTTFNID
jgi:hypothetical protein